MCADSSMADALALKVDFVLPKMLFSGDTVVVVAFVVMMMLLIRDGGIATDQNRRR